MDKEVDRYVDTWTFIPVQPKDYAEDAEIEKQPTGAMATLGGVLVIGALIFSSFFFYFWARA